ncbi:MAG: hypothetical protein CBC48_13830 [bacterium TMED88]|nr:sulfotransferase [Deltaproteobacteria bacterium]OUV27939.1 MAG: hypothetical protein CBC48_13830 [bacterium TMED88]
MPVPQLPLIPRTINRAGAALKGLGMAPARFEAEALEEAARRTTGLNRPLAPDSREGLERLVASLEEDAALSTLGRFITQTRLNEAVGQRLQLEDWHGRHPALREQPVRKPIFIVGQGRTGTTILHELLQLDPAHRLPLTWECEAPFPPPETATHANDPRVAACQKQLDRSESLIPDFKRIHRMGALLPQECISLTSADFRSVIFPAQWRVTEYTRWLLDEADMASAYRMHRQFLQLLGWRCPAERWVLKSPGHLWCLDALIDEYPDACLVQTHRDPVAIISSLTSLECVLRKMCSDDIKPHQVAQEWSGWLQSAYDRSLAFRQSKRLPDSQVVDLHFDRFLKDPVASVRTIYQHFELDLRPEVEAAMRNYVDRNPRDRDGRHPHRFAETGLELDEIRSTTRDYIEYFDVALENRD